MISATKGMQGGFQWSYCHRQEQAQQGISVLHGRNKARLAKGLRQSATANFLYTMQILERIADPRPIWSKTALL
jgi:hypothetical protein